MNLNQDDLALLQECLNFVIERSAERLEYFKVNKEFLDKFAVNSWVDNQRKPLEESINGLSTKLVEIKNLQQKISAIDKIK